GCGHYRPRTFVFGACSIVGAQKRSQPSVTTLAGDLLQPIPFKPQILVHPAAGSIGPFLDLEFFPAIGTALVAQQLAADRLTALLQHLAGPVPDADQLTAATQGIGGRSLTGRECQGQAEQQLSDHHSASRCSGVTTLPSLSA